MVIGKLGLI